MDKQLLKTVWLEKFQIFFLDGIDNKKFLNGITTSNMLQVNVDPVKTCWLTPKGVLKSLIEIHYIDNQLLILILEGNFNEIRNYFENVIFPVDKVKISTIKTTVRIQEANDIYSWRDYNPILLNENDCDEYILKNSLKVLNQNDLNIWKIKQAIPRKDFEINGVNNPLELGLSDLIDFQKGCFLGQEIMARLKNLASLKQEIRVWKSYNPINNIYSRDEKVYLDNKKNKIVGYITSFAKINEKEFIGLAMVKKNYFGENNNYFSYKFGFLKLNQSIGSIFL
ncbi:MAG: folate-binding protein YgfZ [Prochlorococcus sp. SP3034]|nr:folate-binding protein YgfZ [Prochlorococcus sp. SP3034]|tara:strand:+ start:13148 stop:13990 length:843 start_codon:yes stop_codon:yes gene_type:complete